MQKSVVIIGGGLGGLMCGALLAKENYHVCILEKHTIVGGGLHTFSRNGIPFETGMHMISGFQQGGVLRKLTTYLEIFDKLHIKPTDTDGFDHFIVGQENEVYKLQKGKQGFIDSVAAYFPGEKQNIQRYVNQIYEICDNIPRFNLKKTNRNEQQNIFWHEKSASDFIKSFTQNTKLRSLLAWNNSLYAGIEHQSPFIDAAIISKFYIEGSSRFIGGSQQMANALAEIILQKNGKIITGDGVKNIQIENHQIQKITTQSNNNFKADYYISSIHPSAMFELIDTSKIQKSYYFRLNNLPNTYSLFTVFITFKTNSFPYLNHNNFYQDNYEQSWNYNRYSMDNFPQGMMYITPPLTENDTYAKKMIINCVMNYDTVRQWENTTIGKRGQEYTQFKKQCQDKVIAKMENRYPHFREAIEDVFSATPLTIRDYLGTKEGAIYGIARDYKNFLRSYIPVHTKIKNLLLTGQNINTHGILGVSLTAIATCEELLGINYLIDKINE